VAAKLPPAEYYAKAVFPSIAQQEAAKKYIADNWDKVVNVSVQKK
jgi:putative spermidine/putrescine transport system substrate-binding protein